MRTAHFACTWMLAGLIWVIQLVVYPQLRLVPKEAFVKYHFAHCWRIGLLIAPLVAVEGITAVGLLYQGIRDQDFLLSVGLMCAIWLSTLAVQAPLHLQLMRGGDDRIIRKLIRSNWVRTLGWTARGLLVGSLLKW